MEELVASLKELLANAYVVYLKAHGYHWNVEGKNFPQYHEFFGDIYEDVYDSIDPLAENIRKLDSYAPFTLNSLNSFRTIGDTDVMPTCESMSADLLVANEAILITIDKAIKAAMAANQQGIANFLAERDDMHRKWVWQLRASVK